MSWGWSSARGQILSGAWLGVLTHVIPPGLADEAVGDGLAWEMRLRSLPARVTLYFVLGLCLFSRTSYSGVFLQVTSGLGLASPAVTALTAARRRLGEKPLESLFWRLCSPLSPGVQPWSHTGGLLAVAWDGTGITLADTAANAAAFGRPAAGGKKKGPPPAPQARVVTLIACGTRALLGAAIGPCRGKGTGERALAGDLLGCLHRGMLLLADRGFYSYRLWAAAAATGACLLWRVSDGMHLPVIAELPDGSRLARIHDPRAVNARWHKNAKRRKTGNLPPDTSPLPGLTVRVIDYLLTVTGDDGTARTSRYRLITTLLDYRAHPAAVLAAAYSRRWAIETGYREVKTYLRGSGRALRGKTPALARQEIWALLAVCQALRTLIVRAAASAGLDPARVSFTAALAAVRRTTGASRSQLAATLDAAETEILSALVPERKGRICPRVVRHIPFTPFPAAARARTLIAHHATHIITITPPGTTTPTSHDQHKQPANARNQPP